MNPSDPWPSGPATCPVHPSAEAVAACERCGRYLCEACGGPDGDLRCPECRALSGSGAFPFHRGQWSFDGVLEYAWGTFKREWLLLTLAVLITYAVAAVMTAVGQLVQVAVTLLVGGGLEALASPSPAFEDDFGMLAVIYGVALIFGVIQYVVAGVVQMGLFVVIREALGGRPVDIARLFSQIPKAGTLLLQYLLIFGIVVVPLALAGGLGVGLFTALGGEEIGGPGIAVLSVFALAALVGFIWLVMPLYAAPIELALHDVDALQSIRNAFSVARAHRLWMMAIGLVSGAMMMAGLFVFCIGFLPAMALATTFWTVFYLALRRGSEVDPLPDAPV